MSSTFNRLRWQLAVSHLLAIAFTLVAMTATRIAAELLVRNSELEPVSVH